MILPEPFLSLYIEPGLDIEKSFGPTSLFYFNGDSEQINQENEI